MAKFLVVVDVQKDFTIGSLAVPDAKAVIPAINTLIEDYLRAGEEVIYTMDYHHHQHVSFKDQGGPWPPHCVEGTDGQSFDSDLLIGGNCILTKAYHHEELSARFWPYIRPYDTVEVVGLATDYCVYESIKYISQYCTPKLIILNLNCCRGIWNKISPNKFIKIIPEYARVEGKISVGEIERFTTLTKW